MLLPSQIHLDLGLLEAGEVTKPGRREEADNAKNCALFASLCRAGLLSRRGRSRSGMSTGSKQCMRLENELKSAFF